MCPRGLPQKINFEAFLRRDPSFMVREATLITGWGAVGSGIPYNSRESPYFHERFVPSFFPRIQKILAV